MKARYATPNEVKNWNSLILNNPDGGNVFSCFEYGEIKKLTNYKPVYIVVGSVAITVLEKSTPPIGRLWYLPKGPNVNSTKDLFDILRALKPLAKKSGVFLIKIESELKRDFETTIKRHGLKKSQAIIPNPSTITIDLSESLESILTNLPQKGRHAIKRAERDGVVIKRVSCNKTNTKIMYDLLSKTAEGQFGIRSYNYYNTYWKTFEKSGIGQLFFAYFNGEIVAGAYAMVFGAKSTYKDGASIRNKTTYGASHLLQWNVIEWAKSKGSIVHDLCGSPPSDQVQNTDHPHYGVGRFKLSFNKSVTDYIGCYDYVVSKSRYAVWVKFLERVYKHFYYKKTHDYYY